MKLDLNEYTVYEKYGWMEDTFGDHEALDMILQEAKGGNMIESLVRAFSDEDDQPATDDLLAWYLEGNTGFEAIEYWVVSESMVEHVVDVLVDQHELNMIEESVDEFSYASDWLSWRNK